MKNLADMTPDEMTGLSPGEEVVNIARRSPEFRLSYFESAIVMDAGADLVVSLLATENYEVGYLLEFEQAQATFAGFKVKNAIQKQSLVERAQMRSSKVSAVELALTVLENIHRTSPDTVATFRDRIDAIAKLIRK